MEMTKDTITVTLAIPDAQEVLFSINATAKKIGWVLENNPPKDPELLNTRYEILSRICKVIADKLNERAKAQPLKVVK
jgi:hypothetical protein